jgi:transcriptional regulator with XRE-family HTH domain
MSTPRIGFRTRMQYQNLSAIELARRAGLSAQKVGKILDGRTAPSQSELKAISEALRQGAGTGRR